MFSKILIGIMSAISFIVTIIYFYLTFTIHNSVNWEVSPIILDAFIYFLSIHFSTCTVR